MSRDSIFLGHANPQDNEFTLWLYAKLTNEGFSVITDLTDLIGGESDYWSDLQNYLEVRSCKYLLVFSEYSFQKDGVKDEWEFARSVASKHKLKDFVLLLKVDNVAFDERIGTNRMNQFRFDLSWANALKKLVYKLQRDGVPQKRSRFSLDAWLKNRYTTFSGVDKKQELFYSNLLPFTEVPKTVFFHEYQTTALAKAVHEEMQDYPSIHHGSYLVSFVPEPPHYSAIHDLEIRPKNRLDVDTEMVFNEFNTDSFPTYHDLRRLFVRLVKSCFERQLRSLGLKEYGLSGGKTCFYYEKGMLEKDRVEFMYQGKKKRKNLVGKFKDDFWHYAVSLHPQLSPHFCISLKAHLVFSTDGIELWESKSSIQTARKRKGRSYFNKDWRDLMLGFINSVCTEESLSIKVNSNTQLICPNIPSIFECELGFEEPSDNGRIVPIDYHEELEEWLAELDTDGAESAV